MSPRFRFTLDGSKVISEPIGWQDIDIRLDRDMDYHSLVENVVIPLEFYGADAEHDGGYQYLKEVRANGVDTQVEFLAEISEDGAAFETLYRGLLDLTTLIEIEHKKKFQATVLQDSLWSKFINRKAIRVNIQSPTSLDGTAVSVVTAKTQSLPNQLLRLNYSGSQTASLTWALATASNPYGVIDFDTVTLDEIKIKRKYTPLISPTKPFELFRPDLAGDHTIDCELNLSTGAGPTAGVNAGTNVYIQIDNNTPIAFTRTDVGSPNVRTRFTYSATHTLPPGANIRLYLFTTVTETVTWETGFDNFLTVAADTEFSDSTCEAFAIHDVALSITDRITAQADSFYSEYLGGTTETAISYAADGEGLDHTLMKGHHVRGYSLTDKPLALSFDEWWEGANSIFNLGLGYDDAGTAIRCEPKEYFYDDSDQTVILEYVEGIEVSYDTDFMNTSVEIGYQKWGAESASGIDDPQTKHTYATLFKTVGSEDKKDPRILSTFYAASLGIEQTRRKPASSEKKADLDESIIIIQSDLTATTATPITYEAPTYTISNLLNSDTRYNVRLTPAANFSRWKNFLNIGFNGHYSSDFYRFVKGEGNTSMTFDGVQESADVLIDTDALFKSTLYTFKHHLTWTQYKAIRADRTKAIRIIYVGNDGLYYRVIGFIKKLAYKVTSSTAEWEIWPKTINVI
jgi:hypothetical protein